MKTTLEIPSLKRILKQSFTKPLVTAVTNLNIFFHLQDIHLMGIGNFKRFKEMY